MYLMVSPPIDIVENIQKSLPKQRLVICRSDLPENPLYSRLGYPDKHCWNPVELMLTGAECKVRCPEVFEEARRIYWEAMHRAWGTYVRGRPFFNTYSCNVELKVCTEIQRTREVESRVMMEIISTAMATGIGAPGRGVFTRIFGRPTEKLRGRTQ